jgi:DNA mismatch endonuclease (patch repair protein)
MSRIKGKDTAPEKIVRSILHRLGYRFSLHKTKLPGRPDVVLPKHQAIVFVHGCFWHRHKNCKDATMPKTRREWWQAKLEGNAARDRRNQSALRRAGWRVLTVWECETEKPEKLTRRLKLLLKKA